MSLAPALGRRVHSAFVTFVPSELFASAAPFYARYRPGYPPELVEYLVARLALDGRQCALDVGCGTGQLTIPLARHVAEVIAIDPQPAMLRLGRAAARRVGVTNITWRLGDSTQLAELGAGRPHLATFAASFHWTDRWAVTSVLDNLLAPGGAVVVIGDGPSGREEPAWVSAIAEVRTRYLGKQRRAGSGTYSHPEQHHHEMLRASPFSDVDQSWWSWRRELTVEQVVGLQLSYSFSTPALLGDRVRAFAEDVRAAVLALHPSGTVVEPLRVELLVAFRAS